MYNEFVERDLFMKKLKEKYQNIALIEVILKTARNRKKWDYYDVAKRIDDTNINEKTVKKWEYGLLYPDLNTIYKLSEIYNIPSEELVQAKNNSMNEGLGFIHFKFIDWFCYITNASIMVSIALHLFFMYIVVPFFFLGLFAFILNYIAKNAYL